MRKLLHVRASLLCFLGFSPVVIANAAPVSASIDASRVSAPVTRYEYGMFIEPIGTLIARSLWSEMLDDRKFYFPIHVQGEDTPPPPGVEGRPGLANRKWRPLGPAKAITMDVQDPYVGAQSVRIDLDSAEMRGISQSGIGVARGRQYVGHVLLKGTPTASVAVALIWGDSASDRQTITFSSLGDVWSQRNFTFTVGADQPDARLEIAGIGVGALNVGVVSLMPADNVEGWRKDTTDVLRTLHSGFWRFPGGNFLSNWDWHGALGPRDRRAPVYDYAWSAMQPNDLGIDEYLTLTRILGVEPYITVNAGLGDANSAAEEVSYVNGPASTEWGAKRAMNGHPEPYRVKYWNIGNEPYGWWQIGKTTLDYFMLKQKAFAASMRSVDPTITLIASGAMPDQLHPPDAHENASLASIAHKFGTEEDWTGGLIEKAGGTFDAITEHWYERAEQRPEAPSQDELLEFIRAPSNQVRMKAEEWATYQHRYPALKQQNIALVIDEYAYMGSPVDLKLSLAYSMVLQEMLRHSDFLKMAAFTMGTSTLDITPTAATLNSTGVVFKLYGEHFGEGTIPIAVDGQAPQPAPKYPVGFDHPQVRAGSPTYPLDVIAALSADGGTLKIGIVNPTDQVQWLAIDLHSKRPEGEGHEWRMTGATLQAANKVGAAPGVMVTSQRARPLTRPLKIEPKSTTVLEYRMHRTGA